MNMSKVRFVLSALLICVLVTGALAVFAQDSAAPQVTIELTADGLVIPAEMPSGIVAVTVNNTTEFPGGPLMGRLKEGVTLDAFNAEMQNGPMAALSLVSLLGGLDVAPGTSQTVTYDLQAGDHVVLDFSSEIPNVLTFTVTGETSAAAAPEADVEAKLLDFAFTMPLTIPAGEQTWHMSNEGAQWHEMGILKIDENMSVTELRQMLQTAMSEAGPEAGGESEPPVAFWAPMNEGEQAWFDLDLEPGTYVVACFLPDFASGHAHLEMGMTQIFTVQ